MPTATKPPDMPWIMRRIRSSTGDRVKYIKAMTTPKMKRIMDSAKRGPRRSACMDQKGAAIATKKGVTPEISPAQNAASPGARDAQLRCKKERNEGNDANDRDPCPDLYRCHGIHDSFPILHSINAS